MDDLENPNIVARAEALRTVCERAQREPAEPEKSPPPMPFHLRVISGVTSAFIAGVLLLILGYPALSFTVPYYWGAVGVVFVVGFLFGHLVPRERDDV